ncbi:MAG TPA: choice-of-anchor D domain-containing protein [Terracidiphilus sp.]|nr:choice-of-anchor D domain-containing protein [Terracidiphilus sp.]
MKHSLLTAIRTHIGFGGLNAVIAVLLLATSVLSYSQDEQSAAISTPPILKRHVMLPSSAPPGANQSSMKPKLRVASGTQSQGVNTGIGVVYTCASNVATSTCNYLNTVVAGYYNSVFTNANADIYIQYGPTGLGESDGFYNLVHYTPYVTALTNITNKSSIQTSALSAINTYATPIYGSQNIIEVTVTLGSALGFTGLLGINAAETTSCTPYTTGCYNEVVTVANAASQASGGFTLYYDDQGGTETAGQYDFYAVVEHETDEVLGTSSCVRTGSSSTLTDGCDGPAPVGSNGIPSAVDLERFKNPGALASDMSPSTSAGQYFSYDGGVDYGVGGVGNAAKVYNTLANGDDFADYTSSTPDCGTNEAIQDAEGCPGEDGGLNVLNDGLSEFTILNVIGFKTPEAVVTSPTPGSTLSGTSATFTWSAVSGATGYAVYVGTTGVGSDNIFQGSSISTTSQAVTGLPTSGTVYVRVWSYLNGFWTSIDYTYKTGAAAPTITLTPTAVTFPGSTTVGATDATTEVVTVKNTGTASATISGITITGTNPTSFSDTKTCGATLAASASCTVTLTFKPTVTGTNSATLKVADNAGTGSQTASITGTGAGGTAAAITLSATSLTFPNTIDGTSSVAQTITVKNTGTATANLTSIALGGTNPLQFKELTTCGATLAASASCAVYISLKPTLAEALSAVLSITDNAAGSPQKVTLSGTGTAAPPIGLSVTSLAFAATTHATVSLAKPVKITNNGTATVHLISITITGTNPTSFIQINNCATTLAPAAFCTAFVAFDPATTGALSAKLTITDNGAASPQSVTLSGTGN